MTTASLGHFCGICLKHVGVIKMKTWREFGPGTLSKQVWVYTLGCRHEYREEYLDSVWGPLSEVLYYSDNLREDTGFTPTRVLPE